MNTREKKAFTFQVIVWLFLMCIIYVLACLGQMDKIIFSGFLFFWIVFLMITTPKYEIIKEEKKEG